MCPLWPCSHWGRGNTGTPSSQGSGLALLWWIQKTQCLVDISSVVPTNLVQVFLLDGALSCVSYFLVQQRTPYRLRCCLKILVADSISIHLSQFWLFLQLSLSYKPQHTNVAQQYYLLCQHLDMALAIDFVVVVADPLLIHVDCFHLGFATKNSPRDVVL